MRLPDYDRWLAPEDTRRDDHAPCVACGGMSSVLDTAGRCPDCPDTDDALADDEDFDAICDERREAAIAHMIATGYGDEPVLPRSLAWCEADALTTAVSL